MRFLLTIILLSLCVATRAAEPATKTVAKRAETAPIQSGDRVVFLGDSNTYAGTFIGYLQGGCLLAEMKSDDESTAPRDVEFLNLGLSSETASGLSEPDHPFPRPCVLDRIDRALELAKPDVVVVCYGINDAIYYPFSEDRFAKFKDGIQQIIKKSKAAGARVILMTPPPFDALPVKATGKLRPKTAEKFAWFAPYEDYNSVMNRYAEWERSLTKEVDVIVDLNRSIAMKLERERKKAPNYTFAKDGVHFNDDGHRFVAQTIRSALRLTPVDALSKEMIDLIVKRQNILRDAWLTHVGHKRPSVKKGLPLKEAQAEARELLGQVKMQLEKK